MHPKLTSSRDTYESDEQTNYGLNILPNHQCRTFPNTVRWNGHPNTHPTVPIAMIPTLQTVSGSSSLESFAASIPTRWSLFIPTASLILGIKPILSRGSYKTAIWLNGIKPNDDHLVALKHDYGTDDGDLLKLNRDAGLENITNTAYWIDNPVCQLCRQFQPTVRSTLRRGYIPGETRGQTEPFTCSSTLSFLVLLAVCS